MMFTAMKGAHVAHVIAAKVLSTKALIGMGMVAGTVATGIVAETELAPDYPAHAIDWVNRSLEADVSFSSIFPTGAIEAAAVPPRLPVPEISVRLASVAQSRMDPIEAGVTGTDGAIPQLLVVGRRMNTLQKAEYDAQHNAVTRLAQH